MPKLLPEPLGERPCDYCSDPIALQVTRDVTRKKYCSHSCQQRHRLRKGQPKSLKAINCRVCGSSFLRNGPNQKCCFDCAPTKAWQVRVWKYGVGKPQWLAMLSVQGGTCALCPDLPEVVDHDHTSRVVRGLLCYACNIKMAAVDDVKWMEQANRYANRKHINAVA